MQKQQNSVSPNIDTLMLALVESKNNLVENCRDAQFLKVYF